MTPAKEIAARIVDKVTARQPMHTSRGWWIQEIVTAIEDARREGKLEAQRSENSGPVDSNGSNAGDVHN